MNLSKIKATCDNTQNRGEYEECLQDGLDKLETKLSEKYKTATIDIEAYYNRKDLANLEKAQKFWLSYKQANCQAQKELYGDGTDAEPANIECEINLIEERINEIQRIYGKK